MSFRRESFSYEKKEGGGMQRGRQAEREACRHAGRHAGRHKGSTSCPQLARESSPIAHDDPQPRASLLPTSLFSRRRPVRGLAPSPLHCWRWSSLRACVYVSAQSVSLPMHRLLFAMECSRGHPRPSSSSSSFLKIKHCTLGLRRKKEKWEEERELGDR